MMSSDWISYSALCRSMLNRSLALVLLSLCAVATARAQCSFNSGSTGADGAFNPTTSQTVQLPESGVFNFTTVNIPRGVTIKFARNSINTPVTILASGNITIVGTIDISGGPGSQSLFGSAATNGVGVGGPGGFDGGRGGFSFAPFFSGTAGDGPGGGGGGNTLTFGPGVGGGGGFGSAGADPAGGGSRAGQIYGTRMLVPLIGGSGGGGHGTGSGVNGFGGGGGAGAILLATTGTIVFGDAQGGGSILSNGGIGGSGSVSGLPASGGGAGGAIKLVANTITGRITLQVQGGSGGYFNSGGHGYIRVEACNYNSFQPTAFPATTSTNEPMISLASPGSLPYPNAPTLKITSVAGIPAPATPTGSFHGTPDIIVPTAQANPVVVALQASNVPLGTVVSLILAPEIGSIVTTQSTGLAGTVASSTASANVNLPASGTSHISAQLSFTPPGISQNRSPFLIDGERVRRVEVSSRFGGQSEVTYITESGKRIKQPGE